MDDETRGALEGQKGWFAKWLVCKMIGLPLAVFCHFCEKSRPDPQWLARQSSTGFPVGDPGTFGRLFENPHVGILQSPTHFP